MSENLPKGYQVVYIKAPVKPKPLDEQPNQSKAKIERHTNFLVGEMYDEQFPLNLFSEISEIAPDVYLAGQIAINSFFHTNIDHEYGYLV